MGEIPVFVLTSDKYLHALRPFAYLFNRYWSADQPVIVAGFTPPDFSLPDNFSFHSIGPFASYPVTRWSDALMDFLLSRPEQTFVLMLEDYWLTRKVNTEAVAMLCDYAQQFRYVMKIDLCGDRLYAAGMRDYGTCGYLDLVISDPESQYHMSLLTGIWNKENLLRFLIPNETPWEVEINGTPRVRSAGSDIVHLGTRQWPVRHILGFRSGDPSRVNLEGLNPTDVSIMQEADFFEKV